MLGEWGVNIGHMSVGRGTSEREAVMALTLDEPLDASQLDLLVERCGLSFGRRGGPLKLKRRCATERATACASGHKRFACAMLRGMRDSTHRPS